MDRLQEDAEYAAADHQDADHSAAGLIVILLGVAALCLYVFLGASIAFPSG